MHKMKKMTGKSLDLIAENIAQLKALFPEAVTEGKIDFEVLKALLGGEIEKRQTYYKFTWNGKEEARAYARVPSMGTLRPCVAESSGKDGTPGVFDSENLYIEGDNLEVLKLLQGPYHKKVKMIYIDPPYNTGKDFVYPDNYRDSLANYKSLTGQIDAEGVATRANPETSGRYHTDWLNMMYPRLILARNLLSDDGVIFISIDDSEQDNLKKLCNEVFGEESFVCNFVWKSKLGKVGTTSTISTTHEYIICYAKNINECSFKMIETPNEGRKENLRQWGQADRREDRPSMYYPITINGITVFPIKDDGTDGRWRVGQEMAQELLISGQLEISNKNDHYEIYRIFPSGLSITPFDTLLLDDIGTTAKGAIALKSLELNKCFDYSKPIDLILHFIDIIKNESAVILDFFSGSATTAHAVMQLNAEDGGHRHFIMVQLPEVCEEGTEAAKAGYKTICEIGKERIRRAGKKIAEENATTASNLDIGFKVFKLETSNFIPWNPEPDKIELLLRNAVENILIDRTRLDLLYEVLLKCNLPLTLPIAERKFGENTVYVVGEGALAICLDTKIPQTIADEIVKLRDEFAPIVPMQVVFRDNGFTDVAKTNALQILKQAGFEEKSVQTI